MMFSNSIARNPNGHRNWMKSMYLPYALCFSLSSVIDKTRLNENKILNVNPDCCSYVLFKIVAIQIIWHINLDIWVTFSQLTDQPAKNILESRRENAILGFITELSQI